MQICGYFGLIWDEAEELKRLAQISHPRVVVDTAGMKPQATELANVLAEQIGDLGDDEIEALLSDLSRARKQ